MLTVYLSADFLLSMVDRVFAIWQVLNPDSFVIPQTTVFGTYTIARDTTEDANTSESDTLLMIC